MTINNNCNNDGQDVTMESKLNGASMNGRSTNGVHTKGSLPDTNSVNGVSAEAVH